MKLQGILRQLGFNKISEKIYDTLLIRGPISIAELARLTGKHRPAVYKALPKLVAYNLISSYKKGRRLLYKVESPAGIVSLLKKRNETVEALLPEYIRAFETKNKGFKISYYDGERGIKDTYENVLQTIPRQGTLNRIESPRDYQKNKKYYPQVYWNRAGTAGDIEKYVITNWAAHYRRRKSINRESKALSSSPTRPFSHNITQLITTDKVAFIDHDTESAFIIHSDRFAAFYKDIFKEFFKKL